jgi:hypothetical protein
MALAPLRAMDEASMVHTAYRGVKVTTELPGGKWKVVVTYPAQGVKARLNPAGEDQRQLADQPAATQLWNLSLPSGTPIAAGDQWKVAGETNGESWVRELTVLREVFPKSQEVRRRALCVDLKANA